MLYILISVVVTCMRSLCDMSSNCCHLWFVLSPLCMLYFNKRKSTKKKRGGTRIQCKKNWQKHTSESKSLTVSLKSQRLWKPELFFLSHMHVKHDPSWQEAVFSLYLSFSAWIFVFLRGNIVLLDSAVLFQTLLMALMESMVHEFCNIWSQGLQIRDCGWVVVKGSNAMFSAEDKN